MKESWHFGDFDSSCDPKRGTQALASSLEYWSVLFDKDPEAPHLVQKQVALLTFFFFSEASVLPNPSRAGLCGKE